MPPRFRNQNTNVLYSYTDNIVDGPGASELNLLDVTAHVQSKMAQLHLEDGMELPPNWHHTVFELALDDVNHFLPGDKMYER